jgi:hypothetical protein
MQNLLKGKDIMNATTKQVTAAVVIKAAGAAISSGLKAGDALRAYVGFVECSTMTNMIAYEVAYKVLLADPAYTGATKDIQSKVRRLMTDAVRGKAGYSLDKAGVVSVKVAKPSDAKPSDAKPSDAKPKTEVTNAAAISRVAELANTFLPAGDRAKFAECLAMISSKLTTATVGKK